MHTKSKPGSAHSSPLSTMLGPSQLQVLLMKKQSEHYRLCDTRVQMSSDGSLVTGEKQISTAF
jgi:hypothetical protein